MSTPSGFHRLAQIKDDSIPVAVRQLLACTRGIFHRGDAESAERNKMSIFSPRSPRLCSELSVFFAVLPHRVTLIKRAAVFLVLISISLFALFAVPAETAEPDPALYGRAVRSIAMESDLPLERSHYDPYMGIKPGDPLTRSGVKEAIQFLYACGRFSEVVVEAFPENDGIALQFHLRHNYYFNRFYVEGNVNLKGRSLWEWVSLPIGQRFTEETLEKTRQSVLKLMRERGFYLADVAVRIVKDEKNRQVDTIFEVRPGTLATIRSIAINGVQSPGSQELLRKFGFRKGRKYDRSRLPACLEKLKNYFLKKGYLAAVAQVSESFEPSAGVVDLTLSVTNYGKMRVAVEGFKIDKNQLRRLLPALSGEGVTQEILEEGLSNLKEYLENKGYSEADIGIHETLDDSGIRVFRYLIVPSRRFTISFVRFRGNRALTDRELLASVEIQPTAFLQSMGYSVTQLDADVDSLKDLYATRGYLEAEVIPLIEPVKGTTKLSITYLCSEGELSRARSLSIHGNKAISTEALLARIGLAPGGPYSPFLAERERQTLLSAYNDLGYLQAQVTVHVGSPDDAKSYPIEFHIDEGTRSMVDRIFILGNEKTRNSVIGKKIKLKPNEPLSLGKMLQTQQGLYGLGVFDQVRVTQQDSESIAPYQDVVVRLQESKRFTVRYGFGYQGREKLRSTIEFTDLNIFGLARRGDIRLRGSSIEQQAIFNLQQPRFRMLPVESYFTFSFLRKREVSFDSRRFNLSYQFSHPFGNHTWGMLRYNFKDVRIYNSQVPVSELGREDEPVHLSTFSTALVNDSRDDYLDPTKGFFSSTDFGITTKLLGDNDYVSFFSQNSYYRTLPKSFLLAASVRVGLAHPYGGDVDLPISERFFAGGSSSLRGFKTDYAGPLASGKPVGGNALIVGSLEIRIPLFKPIHIAGFYDTGNVFRKISDISLPDFSHTLGAGLRVRTPFGPLRVDYGYNVNLPSDLQQQGLKRGHLFITVGPPF